VFDWTYVANLYMFIIQMSVWIINFNSAYSEANNMNKRSICASKNLPLAKDKNDTN
jgi:hypothetical protein